jgi:proteic killer suppression protein
MIKTIKHKGLKKFFLKDDSTGLNHDQLQKIRRILTALNAANNLEAIKLHKGYKLHELKGDLQGYWSVTVTANYRIVFKYIDGDIYDVDYIDYH